MTKKHDLDVPPAEWAVAGLGVLILVFMLSALIFDATRGSGRPPDISFAIDSVHAGTGSYVVEISVRNRGEETAAALAIEATLSNAGAAVERSQITLDYLPAHSTRHVGIVFQKDPRAHALSVRALGYQRP